ncbi:MAG: hypothetical protein MJ201_02510 [Mycoplasmoidaceae bacterium]|nr:hypothetical protein [Mycoplasmoidaceae bacterium]
MLGVLADAIASAKSQPTKIVGKTDGEILLPEVIRVARKVVNIKSKSDTFVKSEPKSEK